MTEFKKIVGFENYLPPLESPSKKTKWEGIDDEEDDDDFEDMPPIPRSSKVLMSDFGPIPLENSLTSDRFNLHLLCTNFTLTQAHLDILNRTNGVEFVKIFSRYRLLICIGRLFETQEVKQAITTALTTEPEKPVITAEVKPDASTELERIMTSVKDKEHYIVYKLPNDTIAFDCTDEPDAAYDYSRDVMVEAQKLVGGHIFEK